MASQQAIADDTSSARCGAITFLMGLSQLILTTDFSIVSVALPSIGHDLKVPPPLLAWVISAAALTFAGFLVLGGRLTDLMGHRRCLFAGLLLFALGSLASAFAPSIFFLLPARALQGLGAAFLSPSSFSLINTHIPDGHSRHRALGVFGVMQGLSVVIGLVIGGFLTTTLGWRAVFLLNLPFVGLALGMTWSVVPRTPSQAAHALQNLPSAALVTLATAVLLWAVSQIGQAEIRVGATAFVLALIGYGSFYALEARIATPLIPRSIFTPMLIMGCVAGLGLLAGVGGIFLLANLYMQTVLKFSAAASGLGMLPYATAVIVSGQAVPLLLARLSLKTTVIAGFVVNIAGLIIFAFSARLQSYAPALLLGLIIAPIGSLTGYMALIGLATEGISPSQQGLASAVLFTCQQIGVALGGTVCLSVAAASSSTVGLDVGSFQTGYLAAAALAALGLFAVIVPVAGPGRSAVA